MDMDFNNSAILNNNYSESSNKSRNWIMCILLIKAQLLWEFPFTTRFQNSFCTKYSKKMKFYFTVYLSLDKWTDFNNSTRLKVGCELNLVLRKPQQFTSSPYCEVLIIKVLSKFQTFLSGNPGSKIESNLKRKVSNGCPGCTSISGGRGAWLPNLPLKFVSEPQTLPPKI